MMQHSHKTLQKFIERAKKHLAKDKTMIEAFKDYNAPIELLQHIPVHFKDIDVSATTDKGMVFLNPKLLTNEKIISYLVHEFQHVLQQYYGSKATKGSNDDNYLDNKHEQEAFQRQVKYIDNHFGDQEAEKYVDDLLDYHEVPEHEYESKKSVLTSKI